MLRDHLSSFHRQPFIGPTSTTIRHRQSTRAGYVKKRVPDAVKGELDKRFDGILMEEGKEQFKDSTSSKGLCEKRELPSAVQP